MTHTFTYNVSDLKAYTTDELSNIISQATLTITIHGNGKTFSSFFPVQFSEPSSKTFKEFESLTHDEVLSWIISIIGQEEIDELKYGLESLLEDSVSTVSSPKTAISVQSPWS